jgi:hypothetical protein
MCTRSLANFVGCGIGFLNVLKYTPRHLLLAASLSFESEMVLLQIRPISSRMIKIKRINPSPPLG